MSLRLEQVEKKISEAGLDKENCYVAFMEAGITMMGEDDLSGMLGMLSSRNDISVVGGKVYCANGTVAHAGVILCTDKVYGYEFMSQSISKDVYFNHSQYSALRQGVTLFRLKDLMECGSFSTDYTGGYSMIDYTLRMSDAGHKCIYSANANFYIDISKGLDATAVFSSGNEAEDEKLFYKKNANLLENGDLYYTV